MFFWIAVILISIVIVWSIGSIIWTLARGSDAQRRKTLVALLLNWNARAAGDLPGGSARERREAKRAVRQQQQEQHRAQAAHSHGGHSHGHSSSWHHGHSEGHHSTHGSDLGGSHHGGHH